VINNDKDVEKTERRENRLKTRFSQKVMRVWETIRRLWTYLAHQAFYFTRDSFCDL